MVFTMPSLDFDSARIKRIRLNLGLTQEQFAQKLGVNINTVSTWERGDSTPTRGPILKALLDAEAESASA